MIDDAIREYAETPDRFANVPPGGAVDRRDDGEVCVLQGATWAAISAVRTSDIDAVIERVRALVDAKKEQVWWLGPSVEPADLHGQLIARGFVAPTDRADTLHAVPGARAASTARSSGRAGRPRWSAAPPRSSPKRRRRLRTRS